MSLDPATLAEWRRLADAATSGPWCDDVGPVVFDNDGEMIADFGMPSIHRQAECENNAAFIASARTAVPALLAEVERLCADNGRMSRVVTAAMDWHNACSNLDGRHWMRANEQSLSEAVVAYEQETPPDESTDWEGVVGRLRRLLAEAHGWVAACQHANASEILARIDAALANGKTGE